MAVERRTDFERRSAFIIAAVYALLGGLWILFSDRAVKLVTHDIETATHLATLKGWLFIAVTALLLYYFIRRVLARQARAELASRETEQRYQKVVELSPDGIAILTDGTVAYANHAFALMTGRTSAAELQGTAALAVFHPGSRETLARLLARSQEESLAGVTLEAGLLQPDGRELPVEMAASSMPFHERSAVLLLLRDIAARKKSEERLAWLSRVADEVGEGVAVADTDGAVLFSNKAWAAMHGYAPEELEGKHLSIFHSPEQLEKEVIPFNQATLRDGRRTGEMGHTRRDGSHFSTTMTTTVLRGSDGEPAGLVAVARDTTDVRKAAQVQQALFTIASATTEADSLQELYASIHRAVAALMPAENLYIALYEPEEGRLTFPYFVDQFDEAPPPQSTGRTLTDYVLRTAKPLLATPEVFRDLVDRGEVEPAGAPSIDWLGVPLKMHEKVFGAMVVQTYREGMRYSEADLDVLRFVSSQVSMAIEHKHAEEELRESERRFREMLENVQLISVTLDTSGRITFCNDYLASLLALPKEEILGADWFERFVPEGVREEVRETFRESLAAGLIPAHYENELVCPDGSRLISWNNTVLRDGHGGIVGTASIGFDITTSTRAEEALRESEHRFRTLAETTSAGILIYRGDQILYANPAASKISGYSPDEILRHGPLALVRTEFLPAVREKAEKLKLGESVPEPLEIQITTKTGGAPWLELTAGRVQYREQPAWLITAFDITQRKAAEEALKESEGRFRTLAETTSAGILIYQGEYFKYVNSATEAISGFDRSEFLQMRFWDLVHPDHREIVRERGTARQRGETVPSRYEFKINTKSGAEKWVDFSAGTIQFEGRPAGLGTAFDITDRKRAAERLDYLAHHDFLTGLPNRVRFYDTLRSAISDGRQSRDPLAVLLVNLDHFKEVNDSRGHHIGDLLLQAMARRLRTLAGDDGSLARMGGDEFALLVRQRSIARDPSAFAQRVLKTLAMPLHLAGHEFHVTGSIGVSLFPANGEDLETLMRNADIAMRRAQKAGGDGFQFITSDLSAVASERIALKISLRTAVEREELALHYQPQMDLTSGRVLAVEALLRWHHPEFGDVPPAKFIEVAEESALIESLGQWVLSRACAQNRAWVEAGFPALATAVNLSARQFLQKDLVEVVSRTLSETGVPPDRLILEITESTAMWDMDHTVKVLRKLSDLGVLIAIDDFGKGYSSLTYLKRFPLFAIKIDQTFIRDVVRDTGDAAIVTSLISMAHGLKLSVVAEGVETADQMEFLRYAGCDAVQGYFLSRPDSPEALEPFLRKRASLS